MKYKNGGLIRAANGEINTLAHGIEAIASMGKGIAKLIKETFPEVYKLDFSTKKGDRNKLGTVNYVEYPNLIVINAYIQFTFWDVKAMLSYTAFENCMKAIKNEFSGNVFGFPKIGAGLARGDWNKLEKIIDLYFHDEDLTIYIK